VSCSPVLATKISGASLAIPQQIRKLRLGHSGNGMTESYTHAFTKDERDAAEKLGDLFGAEWPTNGKEDLISFPSLSQKQEGPAEVIQQALVNL
jgi:hypothetical protein